MRIIQRLIFAGMTFGISPMLVRAAGPATRPTAPTVTPETSVGIAVDPIHPPAGIDPQPIPTDSILLSTADGTTTAPNARRFDHNDPSITGSNGTMLGRGHTGQKNFAPVSAKDISDALAYLAEHSHNRADAIQSLPDGDRKQRVLEVVARNYVNWMRILHQDPELYKVVVQRVEVEDAIFGLVTKLRKEHADQQDVTRIKLRDQVAELVDLGIQERQIRLQRLQNLVKVLGAKLEDDSAHQSALVDQRLKTILSDGKSLIPSGAGGGNRDHNHDPSDDNR
jgi:hypothetical protein